MSFYKNEVNEIKAFGNMLRDLSYKDFGRQITNRDRVSIRSGKERIGLCLRKDKVNRILCTYDESMTGDKVFSIIYT